MTVKENSLQKKLVHILLDVNSHIMSFSGLILMEADGVTRVIPSRPSASWQTWIFSSEDLASSEDEENTWERSSSSTSE